MKLIILRIIAGIISIFLAGATWTGLVILLKGTGISYLQKLAVYVSHFSFIGWILFLALAVLFYLLISKQIIGKLV